MATVLSSTSQSLASSLLKVVVDNSRRFCKLKFFFGVNSGDHDMFVPFLGTQAWIRSLNYSITDDWRPWMISDQIAG